MLMTSGDLIRPIRIPQWVLDLGLRTSTPYMLRGVFKEELLVHRLDHVIDQLFSKPEDRALARVWVAKLESDRAAAEGWGPDRRDIFWNPIQGECTAIASARASQYSSSCPPTTRTRCPTLLFALCPSETRT